MSFYNPLKNFISPLQLSFWSLGWLKPDYIQLNIIAELLGLNITYLISGEESSTLILENSKLITNKHYNCLTSENQKVADHVIYALHMEQLGTK